MTRFQDAANRREATLDVKRKEDVLDIAYSFRSEVPLEAAPRFTLITHARWDLEIPERSELQHEPAAVRIDERTFRFSAQARRDTVRVRVDTAWTPEGEGEREATDVEFLHQKAPLNQDQPLSVQVDRPSVPRLCLSLSGAFVPDPASRAGFPSGFDASDPGPLEISTILHYVFERLERGLEPAWHHAELEAGRVPLTEEELAADPNERWARLISEKLCFQPYAVPVVTYSGPSEREILGRLQDPDDPAYPITAECQHLCDMAALTRGFAFPTETAVSLARTVTRLKATSLLSATGTGNKSPMATWTPQAAWHTEQERDQLPQRLAPGTLFGYDPKVGFQGQGSHIAFTLRVQPDDPQHQLQLFDTGGVAIAPDPPAIAHAQPTSNGFTPSRVFDYPARPLGITNKPIADGYGTLIQDPTLLQAAVERLARTRPLGLARLLIVRRGETEFKAQDRNAWLVYASPVLRMYTRRPGDNFAITRLLWSLRNHPGREQLELRWLVDVPRGDMARELVAVDRAVPARELLKVKGGRMAVLNIRSVHDNPDTDVEITATFKLKSEGVDAQGNPLSKAFKCPRPGMLNHLVFNEAAKLSDGAEAREGIDVAALDVPAYFRDEDPADPA